MPVLLGNTGETPVPPNVKTPNDARAKAIATASALFMVLASKCLAGRRRPQRRRGRFPPASRKSPLSPLRSSGQAARWDRGTLAQRENATASILDEQIFAANVRLGEDHRRLAQPLPARLANGDVVLLPLHVERGTRARLASDALARPSRGGRDSPRKSRRRCCPGSGGSARPDRRRAASPTP